MKKENGKEQIEHDEKESITQKEFLDGCVGCSSLGCLPFAVVMIVLLGKIF